jgi:hypothetical protein
VNVKFSLCLIKNKVLNVYGRKEVELHSLLIKAPYGADWSASLVEMSASEKRIFDIPPNSFFTQTVEAVQR